MPVRGGRHNEVPDAHRCGRRKWEPQASLATGFRVLLEIPV
jgi:hypothetical protein